MCLTSADVVFNDKNYNCHYYNYYNHHHFCYLYRRNLYFAFLLHAEQITLCFHLTSLAKWYIQMVVEVSIILLFVTVKVIVNKLHVIPFQI